MSEIAASQKVYRLDQIWGRIQNEAEDIIRREYAIKNFIEVSILNHENFEDALAHRLAIRLGNAEMNADSIQQIFKIALHDTPEIGDAARADLLATFERDPACHRYVDPILYFKGYQAIQTHRIANHLWHSGRIDLAYYLQSRVSNMSAIDIHPGVRIGKGIMIDHGHDIVIGETCVIEDNVSIMQGVTLGGTGKDSGDRHPKIRRGVLIGAGAKILGNIDIGPGSRVAACSVVLHNVPANATVAGIPAKVVGTSGSSEPAKSMDHNVMAFFDPGI